MSLKKFIHRGSTKDVFLFGDRYLFKFSDRYSVFDWGEMPDHLLGKGEALARFAKAIFHRLGEEGIKHHLISSEGVSDELIVQPFEVVRDGSSLRGRGNIFLPLEVIFRLGVARGGSVLKRFKDKKDWELAGFDREYMEWEMFPVPYVEFTTKLERIDRPLTHLEAKELSGLDDKEWNSLLDTTTRVANILKEIFLSKGIILWDGKMEFALDGNREIVLVDSIGPDELRLTKDGVQLSKEVIRQFYKKTSWYSELEEAKSVHGSHFKNFTNFPPKLSNEFKYAVEELYQILADLLLEKEGEKRNQDRLQSVMTKLKESL
jgi:phosphoribosylaminoimidazole-succinocarboxamide synthase